MPPRAATFLATSSSAVMACAETAAKDVTTAKKTKRMRMAFPSLETGGDYESAAELTRIRPKDDGTKVMLGAFDFLLPSEEGGAQRRMRVRIRNAPGFDRPSPLPLSR